MGAPMLPEGSPVGAQYKMTGRTNRSAAKAAIHCMSVNSKTRTLDFYYMSYIFTERLIHNTMRFKLQHITLIQNPISGTLEMGIKLYSSCLRPLMTFRNKLVSTGIGFLRHTYYIIKPDTLIFLHGTRQSIMIVRVL